MDDKTFEIQTDMKMSPALDNLHQTPVRRCGQRCEKVFISHAFYLVHPVKRRKDHTFLLFQDKPHKTPAVTAILRTAHMFIWNMKPTVADHP